MLSPVVPMLLALSAGEIFGVVAAVSGTPGFRGYVATRNPVVPRRHVSGLVSALAVLAVLCVVNFRFMPEITMREKPFQAPDSWGGINIAIALEEVTTPDATVGVIRAGVIPYYTGRYSVDFLGKSDPRIATLPPDLSGASARPWTSSLPGHNKYDLEYSIKQLRPTYVEYFAWQNDTVLNWAKNEYVRVNYKGVPLNLLASSEEVRYDKIDAAVEAGEAHEEILQ
jgi:hypothetical protein